MTRCHEIGAVGIYFPVSHTPLQSQSRLQLLPKVKNKVVTVLNSKGVAAGRYKCCCARNADSYVTCKVEIDLDVPNTCTIGSTGV